MAKLKSLILAHEVEQVIAARVVAGEPLCVGLSGGAAIEVGRGDLDEVQSRTRQFLKTPEHGRSAGTTKAAAAR